MSGRIKLETKRCTKCGKEYPKTEEYFYRKYDKRNDNAGLTSLCKTCDKEKSIQWQRNNPGWRRTREIPVVYFVQGKTTTLVKIGHTNVLPRRFSCLQTGSPDILKIIKTLPGTEELEKEIQDKFKHCLHHGEWYNPTPELMEYINAL